MGWEYDGGEDDFNAYCNQNSTEEIFDSYETSESIHSLFFDTLKGIEYLEESDFNVLYFEKFRQSLEPVQSFLKDSKIYLNYDSKGDLIDYRENYESEVEMKNPILYRKRSEIKNLRILLSTKYNTQEFYSLSKRKSDILEDYNNATIEKHELDDRIIFDLLSGRLKSDYFDNSNIIIRLMNIATLHQLYISSNNEIYFSDFILPDYTSEIFSNSLQIENDIPFYNNPFRGYTEKDEYYEGMFKVIQKLVAVFDFIVKLKKNNLNDLPDIDFHLEESYKKIRLQSEDYVLTIEENIGLLNEIKFDFTFYIDKYGELNRIMKFSTDENLTPLNNYNQDELNKFQKEERKLKKNNLVVDDFINSGYDLDNAEYYFCHEDERILYLNENSLYRKESILNLDYDINTSNLILEVGAKVNINGFQFTLLNNESGIYELNGLINESGANLIIDAYKVYGVEYYDSYDMFNSKIYNIWKNLGYINSCCFKYLEELKEIIISINSYIPSIDKNHYYIGDYLVIFDSYVEIKMDCLGFYYITPLNNSSFSTFFDFFNLDKYLYTKEILGYSIESHNIVCRSLSDLNLIITHIQKKIENYSNIRQYLLKVGDEINLGNQEYKVEYHYLDKWNFPLKNTNYSLGKFQQNFIIDNDKCFINIDNFYENVLNIEYSNFGNNTLFNSNSLEELTLKVKLFNLEIEQIKNNNDVILEPNRHFKIAGKLLKYTKDIEGRWFLSGVNERRFSPNINVRDLKDVFECFYGGIDALSQRILGYYTGNDTQVFFKRESDLFLFINEANNEYYKSRESDVEYKIPNSLKIVALDEKIKCLDMLCIVEKNSKGYYLKSTENFSQYKLSDKLKNNIEFYFETTMGYFDGGVFPYCRSLFHLSYFIHCLNSSKNQLE